MFQEMAVPYVKSKFISSAKTLKRKKRILDSTKSKLWDIYDKDKHVTYDSNLENISMPCNDLCGKCNSIMQFNEEGFLTCVDNNCAYVVQSNLDYSPEWRYFAADNKPGSSDASRCGNPIDPLLEESSYACKIKCNTKSSYEMKNLSKWTRWQEMPHKEKALYEEFQIISTMALNAGIPRIFIEHAKSVYKDLYEQKTFRGLKRDSVRAASIWIVCWIRQCPRTSNEIADIFLIDKNSASLGCSMAKELLQSHERNLKNIDKSQLCSLKPSSFIERFCSKLKFSQNLINLACFIAMQVEKRNLIPDNRPQAIALGICYFVSVYCGFDYSKATVKNMLSDEVSEVTINKCFKKLQDYKDTLLPSWVSEQYKNI